MLLIKAFQSKQRLFLHSSNIFKILCINPTCRQATTTIHPHVQKNSIPKPPVPALEHTLKRYLEYASVVANNDKARISHTEKAVAEFRNIGERLQEKLEKIANEEDNWINQFWLPQMYLKVRLPLPVNSNPAYIFPQQNFNSLDEQLSYISSLIRGFCDYKDLIDRKLISREVSTGRDKVQMCMEQYDRMFRCYREPCTPVDILHYKPIVNGNEGINCKEHILVMCNNQTFVVFTRLNGVLLSQAEIAKQLEKVIEMSRSDDKMKDVIIAGGSAGDRDDAAKFWSLMKEDKQNLEALNWIQSASFGVCIDTRSEIKWSENYENNLAYRGMYLLHGFGSKSIGLNRWYDMTIQIIVASDGTNGLCIEHSVAEGIVLINLVEYVMQFIKRNKGQQMWDNAKSITPLQLHWTVSSDARSLLQKQIEVFDDLANDLDLQVLIFDGFGKEFIKSCNISPDGFVQLVMQFAYYRLHGHLVSTYESASIRRFRYGRVDNIRAATPEALRWVEAMQMKNKTRDEKQKLFVGAVKRQAEITLENVTGHGIDNHLCALHSLAKEEVKEGLMQKMPDIFLDPTWIETMRFPLSTSQVTTTASISDTYLCYGPVVKDGYGCSYNIQPHSIIFAPSSFKSCLTTNSQYFKKSLVDSLYDIQALIT
uniref:Choline O-acetyltransferase n=2 Tax=Wuchereria bancrofti TaxID=6293 RepID=A0AAF5PJ46_WUCBA